MRRLLFVMLGLLLAAFAPARAQAGDTMRAVPLAAGERLVLDGRLDHPAWRRAPVYSRFVEKDPDTGGAPPQETRVQVLFDGRALYVGITALDTQPALIRRPLVRNDLVNRTQDFVVVYLDPIGSRRSAQFFRVNAAAAWPTGCTPRPTTARTSRPTSTGTPQVARTRRAGPRCCGCPLPACASPKAGRTSWRIMVARRLPRDSFHLITSVLMPREAPASSTRCSRCRVCNCRPSMAS
jgi:hypothetical protein